MKSIAINRPEPRMGIQIDRRVVGRLAIAPRTGTIISEDPQRSGKTTQMPRNIMLSVCRFDRPSSRSMGE